MYVDMTDRMFVWSATKGKRKHRIEAYGLKDYHMDGLLCRLVVRRQLSRLRSAEEKEQARKGEFRMGRKFVLHAVEPAFSVSGVILPSLNAFADLSLQRHHFKQSSACFDAEKLLERLEAVEAMPLARVSPRTVRMPDGWYAVCGVEQGPFKTRDAAKAALTIMQLDDFTGDENA